jgi:hypothetical protein
MKTYEEVDVQLHQDVEKTILQVLLCGCETYLFTHFEARLWSTDI